MFFVLYDLKNRKLTEASKPDFEDEKAAVWISGAPDAGIPFWKSVSESSFAETVKKADGSFAVAFLDKISGKLAVARDRLGSKQLYYGFAPSESDEKTDGSGSLVYISSDFEPVFEFAGREVSTVNLRHYFSFQYVPEPETIGKRVFAFPAGNYASVSGKDFEKTCYNVWLPHPVAGKDRETFRKDIRAKFETAVRRNLDGCKNPAAFLSGGLDSSILASVASAEYKNLTTYTISFDIPGFSENETAEKTSAHLGLSHKTVTIDAKTFAEAVPEAIRAMGVPVADPSAVAVSLIAKAVAEGNHDVVLSGEGSDELWCGYHVYNPQGAVTKLMKLPKAVKKVLWGVAKHMPDGAKGKDFVKRGCVPLEQRYIGNTCLFEEGEKDRLLKQSDMGENFTRFTKPIYDAMHGSSDMDKMQAIDTNLWLQGDINVVCGKGCEKRGLNCVTPFTDNAVTDLARTLTADERILGGRNKVILREAFDDILLDEVKNGKKRGYPVPVRIWLSGELNDWAREQIASAGIESFVNTKMAFELLDKCKKNPENPMYYRKAWAVTVFAVWYKTICNK